MNLQAYLTELYAYHAWATARVLTEAGALTSAQYFQPQAHSWGSVHGMLLHMFNAEWLWLRRCHGDSPRSMPGADVYPELPLLRVAWLNHAAALRAYLADQTADSLLAEVHYTNTQGIPYHLARWQILAHVANHATHHRGELAAMFAALGAPHGEDDLLYYLLDKTGQRKAA